MIRSAIIGLMLAGFSATPALADKQPIKPMPKTQSCDATVKELKQEIEQLRLQLAKKQNVK